MRIIIFGMNRCESDTIKVKDFDKHFFQARKQAYRIFPDGLTRMRIYVDGVEQESEEVIVFAENGIVPHLTRGLDYSPLALKTDIDMHKNSTSQSFIHRFKLMINTGGSIYRSLSPFLALIIGGLILGWALLQ